MAASPAITGGERPVDADLPAPARPARVLIALVWPFVVVVVLLLALATASLLTLSTLRAYVNGESLWSKAQQDAVLHLVNYARSTNAADYERFGASIAVILGDRAARDEIEKPDFRYEVAESGYLAGGNHPADIPAMIALLRHFAWIPFVDRAVTIWKTADVEIDRLLHVGRAIDDAVRSKAGDDRLDPLVNEVIAINAGLRPLENDFSATLREGSRWTTWVLVATMSVTAGTLLMLVVFQTGRLVREAHAAEQALRQSEARFRALTRLTSDWYWQQDEAFRFTSIDAGIGPLTGVPAGHHIGKARWELPWLEFDPEVMRRHREDLDAHRPFHDLEFRRPAVDGKPVWVSVSGEPRFDDRGRFVGYHGTGKVITDRKLAQLEVERLNRELEQRVRERTAELTTANRELEAFSYSIAHDLAAPLRSINARVSALAEDHAAGLGPKGQEAIDRVREATVRMGQLIDDLLWLSMATRREMHRSRVDLAALSDEIAADLAAAHPAHPVAWRASPVPPAQADPEQIRIALANLLDNAWKFTSRRVDATVEFDSIEEGANTWYRVRDNGVGFDPAYVDQIFKPFHRLHDAREFRGTGIGLAIVERVIARHGGQVHAESSFGRGTTIRFTLCNGNGDAIPA
jgi:PAS domain S-box-containing protein